MQLVLHLRVQMHGRSQFQAQNGNFLVNVGKFMLLALTLPTVQNVHIFAGAEKASGRELLGRRHAKGSSVGYPTCGIHGSDERRGIP
jgi:hypothetical protein